MAKGITNPQARFLAALQRELGEQYSGRGLTRQEASEAIDQALARKAQRSRRPARDRVRTPV